MIHNVINVAFDGNWAVVKLHVETLFVLVLKFSLILWRPLQQSVSEIWAQPHKNYYLGLTFHDFFRVQYFSKRALFGSCPKPTSYIRKSLSKSLRHSVRSKCVKHFSLVIASHWYVHGVRKKFFFVLRIWLKLKSTYCYHEMKT